MSAFASQLSLAKFVGELSAESNQFAVLCLSGPDGKRTWQHDYASKDVLHCELVLLHPDSREAKLKDCKFTLSTVSIYSKFSPCETCSGEIAKAKKDGVFGEGLAWEVGYGLLWTKENSKSDRGYDTDARALDAMKELLKAGIRVEQLA